MREVTLIRRVTAGAGGWAGDGALWSADNAPVAASPPHIEVGRGPSIDLGEGVTPLTGVVGLVRVIDDAGVPIAQQFTLTILLGWLRLSDPDAVGTRVSDWRVVSGTTAAVVEDGTTFTTEPIDVKDASIAFHLVPITTSLPEDSIVEIWANYI